MFEITAGAHFDAAHFLRDYPGKCANLHGHRWKVEVTVRGPQVDEMGILIDFTDLKKFIKAAMEMFDHKLINDIPPFDKTNPTAENMAKYIFDFMVEKVNECIGQRASVVKVVVWEAENASAAYYKA